MINRALIIGAAGLVSLGLGCGAPTSSVAPPVGGANNGADPSSQTEVTFYLSGMNSRLKIL